MEEEKKKTPFTRSEDLWLACSHGKNFETQTFYNVSEDRYENKTISVMGSNLICTSSHGWLVMLGRKTGILNCCFLWNPVTMMRIQLPQFEEEFDYDVVVLTSPPNIKPDDDNNCVVAFFESDGRKVKLCRPGDKEWTVQELPLQNINERGRPVGIETAVTCGGKIYGILELTEELVIIDVGKDHNTMLTLRHQGKLKISSSFFQGQFSNTSLVESCGEVFLTRRIYRKAETKAWEYGKFKIPRVDVFKLDFEELEWREVKTLGDHRAFILGERNISFSCPCSPSSSTGTATTMPESADKIKSNCIYFTAPDRKNLYIYDIKDRSITAYFLFRDAHTNQSIPIWILPVFS